MIWDNLCTSIAPAPLPEKNMKVISKNNYSHSLRWTPNLWLRATGRIRGRLAVDVCPIPPTDTAALCLPLLQKPNAGEQQRYNPQLGPKALEIAIRHSSTHQNFHFCYLSRLAIRFFFFIHVIHTTQKEILKYMARYDFFSWSHLFHHAYLLSVGFQ